MGVTKFTVCCLTILGSVGLARAVFPPPLPTNNPASVFNVTNYGAIGDGITNNAAAIQAAIQAATAAPGGQGGIVEIPAAAAPYLCGPLTMRSVVNLQIDSGATLMMLPYSSWPGAGGSSPTTFINGSGLHDVTISG